MDIRCKIFGHRWNKMDHYDQPCSRKKCGAFRVAYSKKYPMFGEAASGWTVFEGLNL